jgi:hypothetical protein
VSTESLAEAIACCRAGARDLLPLAEEIEDMVVNDSYYNTTLKRRASEFLTQQHGWLLHWHRVMNEHKTAGWDITELREAYVSFNDMIKRVDDDLNQIVGVKSPNGSDPYPKPQRVVTHREVQAGRAARAGRATTLRRLGWAALLDLAFIVVTAIVAGVHIHHMEVDIGVYDPQYNGNYGPYFAPVIIGVIGLIIMGLMAISIARQDHPEAYNLVVGAVAVASTVNYLQHRQARLTGEAVARALPQPPPPPHTPGQYEALNYPMGQG